MGFKPESSCFLILHRPIVATIYLLKYRFKVNLWWNYLDVHWGWILNIPHTFQLAAQCLCSVWSALLRWMMLPPPHQPSSLLINSEILHFTFEGKFLIFIVTPKTNLFWTTSLFRENLKTNKHLKCSWYSQKHLQRAVNILKL